MGEPKVRKEVYDIVDFWLAKGVDGFRMDVISLISKRLAFEDVPNDMSFIDWMERFANDHGARIFKRNEPRGALKYDIVTVGEGPGST